jgi:hypothetical protein
MNLAIVNSLIEEQIEEVKSGGKMRDIALRLARCQGFARDQARYDWVALGFWLLASALSSPTNLDYSRA